MTCSSFSCLEVKFSHFTATRRILGDLLIKLWILSVKLNWKKEEEMMLPYEVVEVWCFFMTFSYFSAAALWGYGLGSAPTLSQVNVSWIGSSTTGSCSQVLRGNKQMWLNTCLRASCVPGSYGGTFTLLILQNATPQPALKKVFKMWSEYNWYRGVWLTCE